MTPRDENIRLQGLIANDRQLASAVAQCRGEVVALGRRLNEAVAHHPTAVARYFNIELVRNHDGTLARDSDGRILGYHGGFLGTPLADPDLSTLISDHVAAGLRRCSARGPS